MYLSSRNALLVGNVVDWLTVFCDDKLSAWMKENGDWNGLIEFYEKREGQRSSCLTRKQTVVWCSVIITVVGIGLGLGLIYHSESLT